LSSAVSTAPLSLNELVVKEVTLVITPKDFFSCAIDAMEQLWTATPHVAAVLYLDTGPHSADLAAYVQHCEQATPGFQRIAYPHMHNFYDMRNAAAALVVTRYTVYVNNDTFVQPGWLEALVTAAEETPKAGVVAPLILERSRTHRDTMHVWWKEMALKRMRGKVGSLLGLAVSLPLLWLACLWAHPMSGLDRRGRVTSTTSTLALKQSQRDGVSGS